MFRRDDPTCKVLGRLAGRICTVLLSYVSVCWDLSKEGIALSTKAKESRPGNRRRDMVFYVQVVADRTPLEGWGTRALKQAPQGLVAGLSEQVVRLLELQGEQGECHL